MVSSVVKFGEVVVNAHTHTHTHTHTYIYKDTPEKQQPTFDDCLQLSTKYQLNRKPQMEKNVHSGSQTERNGKENLRKKKMSSVYECGFAVSL